MRIVTFNNPGGAVVYPAEGISAFGKTRRMGSNIVGEYFGTSPTLQNYTGQWPIVIAVRVTTLTHVQLLDRLTDAEQENLILSQNPKAKVILKRFELAGDLDLNDPRVIAAINALETPAAGNILTAGRAAEILA